MRYFHTTESVQADGEIYKVVARKVWKNDGKWPEQTGRCWTVIARFERAFATAAECEANGATHVYKWIVGTFKKDGTPLGSVTRATEFQSSMPCCIDAVYSGYNCDHMKG